MVLRSFLGFCACLLSFSCLSVSPVLAAACLEYGDYLHLAGWLDTSGAPCDVAFTGETAVVANRTGGLVILSASDPLHPQIVGRIPSPPIVADAVAVQGNTVFVADGTGRKFFIVDITDPAAPSILSETSTGVYPADVAVQGAYAYLAVQHDGLAIFDVSDPAAPSWIASVTLGYGTEGVDVAGDYAYMADWQLGMFVVDVSDPVAAHVVGSCRPQHTWEQPYAVAVAGDYAYLTGYASLWVVDVAAPESPQIVGSTSVYGEDVTLAGHYALVAGSLLAIIDVSSPFSPQLSGSISTGGFAKGAAVCGDYVYVAAWSSGLRIVDWSVPANAPRLGSFVTPGTAKDVACYGNLAVVADYSALTIYDITDPTAAVMTSSIDTPGWAEGITIRDGLAYVADGHQGLRIVDLANPYAPVLVGGVDTPETAQDVALAGEWAYVADGYFGVNVIDVSSPASPVSHGYVETIGHAVGVATNGEILLVADKEGDLLVMDLAIPDSPAIIDTVEIYGYANEVALRGDLGFVVGGDFLHSVDLSSPSDAVILDSFRGDFYDVKVGGRYVYAVGGDMHVVDAGDPAALRPVGMLPLSGVVKGVGLGDRCVCLANGNLVTGRLQCKGLIAVSGDDNGSPALRPSLTVNPNPFNPRTSIGFALARGQTVELSVYDVSGRLVSVLADRWFDVGRHAITWCGRDAAGRSLASGAYLIHCRTRSGCETAKITLLR